MPLIEYKNPLSLPDDSVAITQATSNNSTKIATTAFTHNLTSGMLIYEGLHAFSTTSTSQSTTATYVTISGLSISSVPAGTYLLNFSSSIHNSNNTGLTVISLFVGAAQNTDIIVRQGNGGSQFSNTATRIPISLNMIPFTVSSTSTVSLRWTVSAGTTTMYERYMTLLRVKS